MSTRIPLSRAEEEARLRRERLDLSIAEMGLSVRTTNCLEETGILTVRDLLNATPRRLLSISNFGEKTLEEVYAALEELGFYRRGPRAGKLLGERRLSFKSMSCRGGPECDAAAEPRFGRRLALPCTAFSCRRCASLSRSTLVKRFHAPLSRNLGVRNGASGSPKQQCKAWPVKLCFMSACFWSACLGCRWY